MPKSECTVCELDARPRKLYEALLNAKVGVRDVAEFSDWFAEKQQIKAGVSKSALDRHRTNHHFQSPSDVQAPVDLDGDALSLRDWVSQMFERYQKANKDKVPSHKEIVDLLEADAKLSQLDQRRRNEEQLKVLLGGAAFVRPEEVKSGD